jgi:hypothetical protein
MSLHDPVFDGMKVIMHGDRNVLITCKCYKLKPLIPQDPGNPHAPGRKYAPGQHAQVSSLDEARKWAWNHLRSPDHWTA